MIMEVLTNQKKANGYYLIGRKLNHIMKRIGVIILCLFALMSHAQQNEVQVNSPVSEGYYPNEPSICISKIDSNTVVAGANINYHFVSADGGKTWDNKMLQSTYGIWGDPVLHSDIDGVIYFAHLSRTQGKNKDYGFIDRIVVQTSLDSGKTFNDGSYAGLNEPKMQDKPWLSSDDYSDNFKGNVYLTWTEFDKINSKKKKHKSRIQFSKSEDKGQSWSDAITISDTIGNAVDDDHTLEGATTAVGVNGEIYCVWAGHHKLYFDKSVDGGKTWGKDKIVFDQQSGWAMDIPHVYRSNGMPFLVVDNSNGPYTGRLYLVWGDDIYGDADVFLSFSDDQGTTWSNPIRVHNDSEGNEYSQYLPNVAIDQTTGHLAVGYYDRRGSANNVFNDVYVSVSDDGGASFTDYRMNNLISGHIGKDKFSGDYTDIDFHAGKIAMIWASYKGAPAVYSRVIMESELENLFPIHQVGQIQTYVSHEEKKPSIYIAFTTPIEGTVTYYKRRFFSKKEKVKRVDTFDVKHRPGMQGVTEKHIKATQKRRIRIVIKSTDKLNQDTNEVSVTIE